MRKNKKLLLGGLSVLTLVAAGSGAVSTFAWFKVSSDASIQTAADNKSVTVATNEYNVGAVKFSVVFGDVTGSGKSLSDADGKVWYYAGSTKTQDTSKAIGDTYYTCTVAKVRAELYRNMTTYPDTTEGDDAWTAFNTAAHLKDALNSLVSYTITVTIDNTYGGAYDSQLKFKASTPTLTTGGWADTKSITATKAITAIASLSELYVDYTGFTGLTSDTFYIGIQGADDNGTQNALSGQSLTVKGSVAVAK